MRMWKYLPRLSIDALNLKKKIGRNPKCDRDLIKKELKKNLKRIEKRIESFEKNETEKSPNIKGKLKSKETREIKVQIEIGKSKWSVKNRRM